MVANAQPDQAEIEARNTEARAQMDERRAAEKRRNDFAAPRLFASIGDAYAHEHDASTVGYLAGPADEALSKLTSVASNDRLTPQARGEDFMKIKSEALAEIEARYDRTLADIEADAAALEKKGRRSLTSDIDPNKLLYVRSTLEGKVRAGQLNEYKLEQHWEQALEEGDLPTLQVLYDNGAALIREARPAQRRDGDFSKQYHELMARTDEALGSPEQKKARAALRKLEATRWQARKAHMAATRRLKSASMQGNQLVDSDELERQRRFRSSF